MLLRTPSSAVMPGLANSARASFTLGEQPLVGPTLVHTRVLSFHVYVVKSRTELA